MPKRSDQIRGAGQQNARAALVTKAQAGDAPDIPEPSPDWHAIARMWWDALPASGQVRFYEQSDWAMAYLAAEMMSKEMSQPAPRAPMISQILSLAGDLMTTEGSRRKLRVELQREPAEAPAPKMTLVELNERFGS